MTYLGALFVFVFVTVPSIIYSISAWILTPIGLLVRLFTSYHFAVRIYAPVFYKLILPIFLIVVIPIILYVFAWRPLCWIFLAWMISYFIARRFSGVHHWQEQYLKGLKQFAALNERTGKNE